MSPERCLPHASVFRFVVHVLLTARVRRGPTISVCVYVPWIWQPPSRGADSRSVLIAASASSVWPQWASSVRRHAPAAHATAACGYHVHCMRLCVRVLSPFSSRWPCSVNCMCSRKSWASRLGRALKDSYGSCCVQSMPGMLEPHPPLFVALKTMHRVAETRAGSLETWLSYFHHPLLHARR